MRVHSTAVGGGGEAEGQVDDVSWISNIRFIRLGF